MSEEIKKAYKLFNREDLIDDGYKRDLDSNIQVFLTTKEMINYMNLQQKVEQLEKENKKLQSKINDYENPDDLALFYMWLDEKAKDKIKQLENIRKEAIAYINKNWGHWCSNHCKYATETINILNKGSDK